MMTKLKQIRKEAHETQANVAKYLGITPQGYSLIENGKRGLQVDMAVKLAQYFRITVEELIA